MTDINNDGGDPVEEDLTALTWEQQQRQEALWAAGSAMFSESAGHLFSRGSSRTAPGPNALIAVAHFITTGGRDYLPADLARPLIAGPAGWVDLAAAPASERPGDNRPPRNTAPTTEGKSESAQHDSVPADPDDPWHVDIEGER